MSTPKERLDALQRYSMTKGIDEGGNYVQFRDVRPIVADFEHLLRGLAAVEKNCGRIDFLGDGPLADVKIKYEDAPAFYADTLGEALEIAIRIEGDTP